MADKNTACLCVNIPTERAMTVSCNMKVVAAFHMECPLHGVVATMGPPMRRVLQQKWATVQEAFLLRRAEGARVVEKSADRKTALIEWVEWERIGASGADSP